MIGKKLRNSAKAGGIFLNEFQIVWRGPVMDATGYGTASRGYALALDRLGMDVKIEPYTWNFPFYEKENKGKLRLLYLIGKNYNLKKKKVLIYHSPPGNVRLKKDKILFEKRILNTVWETLHLPKGMSSIINRFDAVCVPYLQNMEAMKSSGVKVPVYLAPHGVDANKYNPDNKKYVLSGVEGRFVFLSVFDFQHRKNPEALLEAYWKEFSSSDRVCLVIKTYGGGTKNIEKKILELKRGLKIKNETAPVKLLTGTLDDISYKGLFTAGDVFVLPTRGEGVGIPYMEALSSGIPVIATGWGGQMDFLSDNNSYLVEYNLCYPGISMKDTKAISTINPGLYGEKEQLWAEVVIDDLRKKMREAYEQKELTKLKGKKGREDMLSFTWEKGAKSLIHAIQDIL